MHHYLPEIYRSTIEPCSGSLHIYKLTKALIFNQLSQYFKHVSEKLTQPYENYFYPLAFIRSYFAASNPSIQNLVLPLSHYILAP